MKNILLSVLTLFAISAQAECGPDLQAASPLLNTAVHDLAGFGYVRQALAKIHTQNPFSELCVSGIILSKDVYQYGQFFIKIDVRSTIDQHPIAQMRFLFQDASTQAFQNMHRQPWAAVNVEQVTEMLTVMDQQVELKKLDTHLQDPLALARSTRTYAHTPEEPGTMMAMPIDSVPGMKNAYLVSWLSRNDGNPFAQFQVTRGVVVGVSDNGQAMAAEDLPLYNSLVNPLETMREKSWPAGDDDYSEALIRSASLTSP